MLIQISPTLSHVQNFKVATQGYCPSPLTSWIPIVAPTRHWRTLHSDLITQLAFRQSLVLQTVLSQQTCNSKVNEVHRG